MLVWDLLVHWASQCQSNQGRALAPHPLLAARRAARRGLHHPRWTPTAYALARERFAGHVYVRYDQMRPLDRP